MRSNCFVSLISPIFPESGIWPFSIQGSYTDILKQLWLESKRCYMFSAIDITLLLLMGIMSYSLTVCRMSTIWFQPSSRNHLLILECLQNTFQTRTSRLWGRRLKQWWLINFRCIWITVAYYYVPIWSTVILWSEDLSNVINSLLLVSVQDQLDTLIVLNFPAACNIIDYERLLRWQRRSEYSRIAFQSFYPYVKSRSQSTTMNNCVSTPRNLKSCAS